MPRFFRLPVLFVFALVGCATPAPPGPALVTPPAAPPAAPAQAPYFTQTGRASFYGAAHQGRTTANGESFDLHDFTAAHRTLPFGTVVRVTNLDNGLTVKVKINDRGPHVKGRIIDLSSAAARALGMTQDGVARVKLEAFRPDQSGAG
ncbi:MAG TPA: septal ring lytic transglycosylase RlpA family protein [Rhizomicrobium sp.]|nr:septal ring lytic transglycosylase RlpA family protein [Rhizomicrobium sp.]